MKRPGPTTRSRHRIVQKLWWLGFFLVIFLVVLWSENVQVSLPTNPRESTTVAIRTKALQRGQNSSWNVTMVTPWPFISASLKWCRRRKTEDNPGLIYVKVPKTGSSTMVGINIRIAHKVGERSSSTPHWWRSFQRQTLAPEPCSFTYHHGRHELLQRQEPFLLWSVVRDPAARALSEFYHFEVSRGGRRPTDLWAKAYLNERRNYQFLYLADHPDPKTLLRPMTFPRASDDDSISRELIHRYVLQPYHFIGLLERKFESLAVIKLLWGLETHDFTVLSSKSSGGYDDGRFDGSCIRIQQPPNPPSPFLQGFISESFQKANIDYLLYEMVNMTLDKTIRSLGIDAVSREVENLKAFQTLAEQRCQATAIFPCSQNGTLQLDAALRDCYWSDSGCGHACIDRALQEH